MTQADLLTAREVAAWLGVPASTVYQWAKDGRLPRCRLGPRCLRFVRADIEAFIRAASRAPD